MPGSGTTLGLQSRHRRVDPRPGRWGDGGSAGNGMESALRSQGALAVVRRRWRWLVGLTVLGVLAALVWSMVTTPTYRSTGRIFFSLEYGDSAADLVQGSNYTQAQVASFAQLVDTPAVLQPVIDDLGLDLSPGQLADRVEAAAPVDTVIVEVSVTDTSPAQGAAIANAVIDSLSTVVEDLAPANAQGRPTVRATTVADAVVPTRPAAPDLWLALGVGLVAGLLLGAAAAAAREALDNRVRDAEVVAQLTQLPIIGTIPARAHRSGTAVVVETDPHSPHAEAFRLLRTNLQFVDLPGAGAEDADRRLRVVAVTSSLSAEGKSTIAANLAVALAETGARVLLVDADLRRPSVADLLGIEGAVGLTTVLLGRVQVADVVQDWGAAGLQVLPSGPIPPNPTELLGSPAMRQLVDQLRASYDYVVVDTGPLLAVADAAVLSRVVDGSVVVANVTRVRRQQFTEALRTLAAVDGRVLGLVLNRVHRESEAYSYERQDGDGGDARTALSATVPSALAQAVPAAPAPSTQAATEPAPEPARERAPEPAPEPASGSEADEADRLAVPRESTVPAARPRRSVSSTVPRGSGGNRKGQRRR